MNCPLCGQTNQTTIARYSQARRQIAIPGEIIRCNHCRFWFKKTSEPNQVHQTYTGPAPASGSHGASDISHSQYAQAALKDDYHDTPAARAFFRHLLKQAMPSIGRHVTLLDVGCGTGVLMEIATELGCDTEGVELCAPLAQVAQSKGLSVHAMPAEDLATHPMHHAAFDIVTALDIIEHTPDPATLLRAIHDRLTPGGLLVVYTPNHRSTVVYLARFLRQVGIDAPFNEIFGGIHVSFFTDRTLRRAVEQAGFTIERHWLFPTDLRRPGMKLSFLTLLATRFLEELGRPFGAVCRQVIFARKSKT